MISSSNLIKTEKGQGHDCFPIYNLCPQIHKLTKKLHVLALHGEANMTKKIIKF